MRRKRPAPFHGAFVVRAESRLHFTDPAVSGNSKYPPWPDAPGFSFSQCAEFPREEVWDRSNHHAGRRFETAFEKLIYSEGGDA